MSAPPWEGFGGVPNMPNLRNPPVQQPAWSSDSAFGSAAQTVHDMFPRPQAGGFMERLGIGPRENSYIYTPQHGAPARPNQWAYVPGQGTVWQSQGQSYRPGDSGFYGGGNRI